MSTNRITHRIIEQLPTMVAYVDEDRCFRFVNTAYASFFDLTPDGMLGKPVTDVLTDESYQRIKPNHDRVFATGEKLEFSDVVTFRNGRKCFLDVSYLPDIDEHDNVIGLHALIEDVTDYYASVDLMRTIHELIHKRGRRIDPASIDELLRVGVDYLGVDIGMASSI